MKEERARWLDLGTVLLSVLLHGLILSSLPSFHLQCELDHDNEVSCVDVDTSATRVASGTVDGGYPGSVLM